MMSARSWFVSAAFVSFIPVHLLAQTRPADPRVAELAKEVRAKGWILYGFLTPRLDMDLFLMRPDGSDQRRITDTPEYHEGAPKFSHDGRKILYRRFGIKTKVHHNRWGYQGHVVIANADGSDPVVLGKDGEHPWASWSPDGKQIACLTLKGIKIIDIATKEVVRTMPRKGMYQQLYWSPDGKWFCGVTNAYGEMWTVARMNALTGEMNPLKKSPIGLPATKPSDGGKDWQGAECTPDWFPDSKHVLFSHNPIQTQGFGYTQLWMADGEGKHQRMVYAENGRHIYGGTLSPEAKYVLFSRVLFDGAGGLASGMPMGLIRFSDRPCVGGKSKRLREMLPDAEEAVVLDLPVGWEPDWTYKDIPSKP
ncbi:MAG: PD40 domain-containing protein [Phycisphaerae bacterium]|nr:PD40 domain-containing protein [Phycisphaerae bacterium]